MTETVVTFSEFALRALVNDPTLTSGQSRTCRAGLNRLPGRLELLVHSVADQEPWPTGNAPRVVVLPEGRPELLGRRLDDVPFFAPPGAVTVVVALGVGMAAGRLAGACRVGSSLRPLDSVRVAGAGLATVRFLEQAADPTSEVPALPWPEEEMLSRTIGALGEEAWRRLRGLHVALVGCGRTGSLMAIGLRRLGVRRLTLLDPDRLEPHNLGEMEAVGPADVGRLKAEALADALVSVLPASTRELTAVPGSVLSLSGLVALKPADMLVCCADRGSARLATALLAALYLKPLLDIGTGVLNGPRPAGRRIGADVRLVLPERCLLCLGGIADLDAARRELLDGPAERAGEDWRRERRGSLWSLNATAVGLALRLLEDFMSGLRADSTWLHLETDATGLPTMESRSPSGAGCPVCARAGTADAGLSALWEVMAGL
jgi:hypothetical protein